jgi:signal transduction histidine kinase
MADTPVVGDEIKDVQQGVNLIQRNLLRVDELIRKFRKLSVGQLVDTREDLDLGQAVRDALQLWSREGKKANINVEVITQLTPGLFWGGYAGHLSQVVMALLSNARMHAYPEGAGGKVEVTVTSKPGPPPEFSVSVRDWGKGIPPEILPNIFDAFFTTARVKGATGLGLSIAQNIVHSIFGGTLRCVSTPGEGSTFTATFSHCPPSAAT